MKVSEWDRQDIELLREFAPNGEASIITVDEETGEGVSLYWQNGKLIREVIKEPEEPDDHDKAEINESEEIDEFDKALMCEFEEGGGFAI